jgi:hypothetical protein
MLQNKPQVYIPPSEYQQKRYETARDIIASVATADKISTIAEDKQRDSLIFNCILLADALLEELGYYTAAEGVSSPPPAAREAAPKAPPSPDKTTVRSLKSIIDSGEE